MILLNNFLVGSLSRKIKISTQNFEAEAILLEDERPKTCDEIWDFLPIEREAVVYKEEIYFDIPIEIEPENPTPKTEQGDVSYWPDGPGFCVFFGDSQPVSSVNTFARVEEGVEMFREVGVGEKVTVCKVE